MKKLKISVAFLAFMGLAALNFTQSERCFVSKALASSSNSSSSDIVSTVISWISSTWDEAHTKKCSTRDCEIETEIEVEVDAIVPPGILVKEKTTRKVKSTGKEGFCDSGTEYIICPPCLPLFCS